MTDSTPPAPDPAKLAEQNEILRELIKLRAPLEPIETKSRDPGRHAYYKPQYGKPMLFHIEGMYKDKLARIFRKASFPGLSHQTIYMKIKFGLDYARDFLIKDPELLRFAKDITVRKRPQGTCLFYMPNEGDELMCGVPMSPDEVAENYETIVPTMSQNWNTQVQNFIETALPGDKLQLRDLRLSDEEVVGLRRLTSSIDNLIAAISHYEVKLVKLSPEDYQAMMNQHT